MATKNCCPPHKLSLQLIDPSLIKGIWLCAFFTQLPDDEEELTEDETYSNIDLEKAEGWKVAVEFDEEFSFELSYIISRLLEHKEEDYSKQTVKSLIPTSNNSETKSLAASALGPLIDKPAVNFELVPRLDIFADDDFSHEHISDCLTFIMRNEKEGEGGDLAGCIETSYQDKLFRQLLLAKSAPPKSLTRRLSTCLLSRIDKNLVGFSRLWMKFLEILRHHWEYNLDLPGFGKEETPDLACCLLHQKLQMIQYCIEVKRKRHSEFEANQQQQNVFGQRNDGGDEDDEFFDAIEDFDEEEEEETTTTQHDFQIPHIKSPEVLARGRSELLDPPQFLKNNPNKCIYVPVTLEQGPMTGDQLSKHESFLLSLNDSNLRNRAQSDLLLSDMQAFKAANPGGAVLEDFLRWHSPRDLNDDCGNA